MATLKQYYETDFTEYLRAHKPFEFGGLPDNTKFKCIASVHFSFKSNSKFISFFVPKLPDTIQVCLLLIKQYQQALSIGNDVYIEMGGHADKQKKSTDLLFTRRVYIYHETELSEEEVDKLEELAKEIDLYLIFRGRKYLESRVAMEKPLVFISHDSRDKDEVRKLAIQLIKMMCPVWYDEFSLKVGDNLRDSIEKGLKECKKCILFLTPQFFSNSGWTKREFDSIFTRELIEEENVVLPVWHNIEKKQVYQYSPSLANVVAVKWDLGVEEVARKLFKVIT